MAEQTILGGKLWDEILKAIVYAMPKQFLPLINEVYGKDYPPDTPIILLNTEHSTYTDQPGKNPSSNLMDISLLVAETDYYHIECQMKNDKLMVIRMISYDLHYAIEHCMSKDGTTDEIIIRFPHSVVLYPDQNNNLPDSLRCRIIFQDGSEHVYRIPTVRIQSYSLKEIHEKHLNLFIPYLLLRLKPRLTSKRKPLSKNELTSFLNEIIVILQEDFEDGYLTKQECDDYLSLLVDASRHIFNNHSDYHAEVQNMTKPLIYLPSMQITDLKAIIAERDSALAENKIALAKKDSALVEKDSALAKQAAEIASLKAKLAALSQSN